SRHAGSVKNADPNLQPGCRSLQTEQTAGRDGEAGVASRVGQQPLQAEAEGLRLAANLQQVPNLLNTAAITSRVYSLSLEENKKMAIKEVMYVDLSRSANYTGSQKAALARPFWVPAHIQQGCWSEQPPCYWKVDIHSMQELDNGAGKLIYNPLADYTLELMRFYRPDLFEHIFHLFRVWCKRLYNDRQVSTIKEIIQAEKLPLEDFSAHFSQTSPVVPTLRSATLADDILPEIEHYLALLSIRAYLLRDTLMHIR
uniref:NDC10_II domain-containing protein n=1 Tax=Macrostomum lignano TaxID=282301 RepID=A0A1I8HQB6_9PLAT